MTYTVSSGVLNSTPTNQPTTTRTRQDHTHGPLGSPTSSRTLSGRRRVRSISTCTDFVRGSGLVGSGRRQGPWVRVVELSNDTTRPRLATKSGSARAKFHTDRTRPDPTKSTDSSETQRTKSGRARLVEFGHNCAAGADYPVISRRRLIARCPRQTTFRR